MSEDIDDSNLWEMQDEGEAILGDYAIDLEQGNDGWVQFDEEFGHMVVFVEHEKDAKSLIKLVKNARHGVDGVEFTHVRYNGKTLK
jgi:hypothetical protein